MKTIRSDVRGLLGLAALSFTLGLAGCFDSKGSDAGPTGPGDPTLPEDPTAVADLGLFLADPDPSVREAVLDDYDFELVAVLGSGRALFVNGEFDPGVLIDDSRILAFQTDGPTEMSSPVELTMSFYEGDFDAELPDQDAFGVWQLEDVHARGRGNGMRVAVLDTGVDPTHPLLAGRVSLIDEGEWGLGSIETERGVDTDGDGVPDEAYGHGTHVAGIIATVAPDAEILSIRVLDSDGVGTAFELALGLYRAAEWGADIINLSLVLSDEADLIEAILDELEDDIVIVGAAGNRPGEALFPARDDDVVAVAALDSAFELADFTATGDVDLAAPGVEVLSAFPGGRWASATGTSMAAGSASGALAVVGGLLLDAEDGEEVLQRTGRSTLAAELRSIDLLAAVLAAPRGDD